MQGGPTKDAPDYSKFSPESVTVPLTTLLASVPDWDRNIISKTVEKLYIGILQGDVKLTPAQLQSLTFLGKKFVDNAPTLKDGQEEIDHLAVLTEAFENNATAFNDLIEKTKEFFTLEEGRRDSLIEAMNEEDSIDNVNKHVPELDNSSAPGINLPTPGDHRFDEIPLFQGPGVQSSEIPAWVPHKSA